MKNLVVPKFALCMSLSLSFLFPASVFAKPALTLDADQMEAIRKVETQSMVQGVRFYSDRSKTHQVNVSDMIDGQNDELFADISNPKVPNVILGLHTKSRLADDGTIRYAMEITNSDFSQSLSAKSISLDPANLEESQAILKASFRSLAFEAGQRAASLYTAVKPHEVKGGFTKLVNSIFPSAEAQLFYPGETVKQKAQEIESMSMAIVIFVGIPLALLAGAIGILVFTIRTATYLVSMRGAALSAPGNSVLKKRLMGLAISTVTFVVAKHIAEELSREF